MMKCIFLSSFVFLLSLVFSGVAVAQENGCSSTYQQIFEMREPDFGSYNVWDTIYGEQDYEERFVEALPVGEDGHNIVVGEKFGLEGADIDVLLVMLDRRGRTEWEKTYDKASGLNKVVAIEPHGSGYVVLANKGMVKDRGGIWIGFFDGDGEFIKSKEIKGKKGNLAAYDLLKTIDGDGYFIVGSFEDESGIINSHAIIYRIDNKGAVVSDRAYMPGLENRLFSLNYSKEHGYFATGYVYDDSGRKTGWVLGLNDDGSILWQQQYPRGRSAQIHSAKAYGSGYLVVTGHSEPYGGGNVAGWVAMLASGDGKVVWQRYYRGGANFYGRALLVSDDGLVSVMLGVQAMENESSEGEKEKAGYVRLLTLNPRGDLLFGDSYFNGLRADAAQIFLGPGGQRIMVGSTFVSYNIEGIDGEEDTVKEGLDGWVVSAVGVEPYNDPCVR